MFIKINDAIFHCVDVQIDCNSTQLVCDMPITNDDITSDKIQLLSDDEMLLNEYNTSDFHVAVTSDAAKCIYTVHIDAADTESLDIAIKNKLEELSDICTKTIYDGLDIKLSDGTIEHFTLDEHDQLNLSGIGLQLGAGAEMISWHQDDVTKPCRFYTAEDAQKIINTLTVFKSYHITYFRDLRIYVNSLENIEDVKAIYYGYILPDKAKSDVLKYYESLIMADKAVE